MQTMVNVTATESSHLTKDQFKEQMRRNTKKDFQDDDLTLVEEIVKKGEFDKEVFMERLISFSETCKGLRNVGPRQYIKAVQYCSYVVIGDTQIGAYSKTFPDRVATKSRTSLSVSASTYHHTELVQRILSLAVVPVDLIFHHERYAAIEKLSSLMMTSKSERIQMESADKLLTHLKPKESSKVELSVSVKGSDRLEQLETALATQAAQHMILLQGQAATLRDVAEKNYVDAEEA